MRKVKSSPSMLLQRANGMVTFLLSAMQKGQQQLHLETLMDVLRADSQAHMEPNGLCSGGSKECWHP